MPNHHDIPDLDTNEYVSVLLPYPTLPVDGGDGDTAASEEEFAYELQETIIAKQETHLATAKEAFNAIADFARTQRFFISGINRRIPWRMGLAEEEVVSIDDVDPHVGPPPGSAIFNPYTNVLTVPAPQDQLSGIESAIQRVNRGLVAESVPIDWQLTDSPLVYEFLDAEVLFRENAERDFVPWGVGPKGVNAPAVWAQGIEGQNVVVAIVDSGVDETHFDLPMPLASRTFIPNTNSTGDETSHGTHVAGTILARRNGKGVVGVAPRAEFIVAKVLNSDKTSVGNSTADGITWAVNMGAHIINLSLGGKHSDSKKRALAFAQARNVLVLAATGNGGMKNRCVYPAAYDPTELKNLLAVGSVDRNGVVAKSSNCCKQIGLVAPGVEIRSTLPGGGHGLKWGTSMATPHVSGVAALLLCQNPGVSAADLREHLVRSCISIGNPLCYGAGLVKADRALSKPVGSAMEYARRPQKRSSKDLTANLTLGEAKPHAPTQL